MDLNKPSEENLKFMLEEMSEKLDVANQIVFDPKGYNLDKYDELKYMYEFIVKQDQLSAAEIQAFVDELRTVRKEDY